MKHLILILSIIFCFIAVDVSASDDNLQKNFIKNLYEKGYYFRTITEALRFIFHYPNSPYIEEMEILIAESYLNGGDEESALSHYLRFINEYPDSSNMPQVFFKIGKLYSKNRAYVLAKKYFEKTLSNNKSSEPLILKAKKWIVLLSLLMDIDYNEVQKTIHKYELSNNIELLNMAEEYKSLDFKSPKVAGTLSALVPGAGQLYLNRKRDAAASFILNGVFIWGIIESFNHDNIGVGILLSVFEFGWYGGNIYSAVNGAYKHNRKLKDSYRNKFSIGLNINVSKYHESPPSFILSVNYRF